jgi:mannose-6-phosphate isomerase
MVYLEESMRPWGKYQKFFQDDAIWIKRLEVYPKSRLSLQKHQYRFEKWIVIQGEGTVILDSKEIPVEAGSVIDIPLGAWHRMCNGSEEMLVFVEIAYGEYLAEDDIVRLEDDYHRVLEEQVSSVSA